MPSPVLQFKRGAFSNLPGLRAGEPALTTDKYDLYVGIDSTTNNNKFFGSARYWSRENGTNSAQLKFVDKDGTNFIAIAASNTLAGIATYRLPNSNDGSVGDVLKIKTASGGVYELEWDATAAGNFTIAGDTGSDTFNLGETLTFAGTASEIETAVTNNQVQIGLPSNVVVGASLTVTSNLTVTGSSTLNGNVTLGDNTSDDITVGGEFVSSLNPSNTNAYDLGTSTQRWRDLFLSGNLNVAGVITAVGYNDLTVTNRDIVMGYIDGLSETDTTANHGGIAVASTEGYPLVNLDVAGINTLPTTYKQIMWVKGGTMGAGTTDAWLMNYAVGVGSTQVPTGVVFAAGSVQVSSAGTVTANNFSGSLTGNASSADQVKTVTAGDAAGTYYVTFVNSLNGSATNETVYTDDGIYYNPGSNKLTTQNAELTGNLLVSGISTIGDSSGDTLTVNATATFAEPIVGTIGTATRATTVDTTSTGTNTNYHLVFTDNATSTTGATMRVDGGIYYNPSSNYLYSSLFVGDVAAAAIKAADTTTAMTLYSTTGDVAFNGNIRANDGTVAFTLSPTTGNVTFNNSITVPGTITGTATTATRATQVDTTGTSTNATYYVPFVDTFAGETGETIRVGAGLSVNPFTGNVGVTSTLSVGSVNEVNAFIKAGGGSNALYLYSNGDVSFQAKAVVNEIRSSNNASTLITLNGLDATFANNVTITGIATAAAFSGPLTGNVSGNLTGNVNSSGLSTFSSINVANINSSLGVSALTITGASGAVTASNNLTVNGDLFVNGTTTQINTTELTVNDRTITLGIQTGATPTTTTWDLGVMMNYGDAGVAKTAGVIWDYSVERFVFSANSDNPASGSNTTTPVITVATHAPIEIASLWVNDCAGQSQVISCTGNERFLENITVDAGTF